MCMRGIQLTGNITFPDVNNRITTSACNVFNIIGDPATLLYIGGGTTATQTSGIRWTNQAGFIVKNNKVTNVSCNTTTDGIFIETFFAQQEILLANWRTILLREFVLI
ncbi:MAG: hypothetical protein IPP29_22935 [Bacteroidetes bacterium]|nr:hypothetical protein [Bacteroidota bacterium]